ncbi:MAG: protease family protein [Actinomycetota bacterium]|jgi:membrane protease YdiL (CAAX protease family)|nr:protease family protein [Actinomycetota bacterium]
MTDPPGPAPDEGPAPVVAPRWGLGDAALAFAAGLLGTVVTTTLYVVVTGRQETNDTGAIVASLVGLWAGIGGVAVWTSRRKGTGGLAVDYGLRIERRDVAIGMATGVVCQFVLVPVIVKLFSLLDRGVDVAGQAKQVTGGAGGLRLILLAPFLCLGAPFFEELYFRGLLQRAAVRRLGAGAGIAISAVAFGLVHAPSLDGWSAVALACALGAFGAVLSLLAHRTGRLGPGLVAHATFNAITLIGLAIAVFR